MAQPIAEVQDFRVRSTGHGIRRALYRSHAAEPQLLCQRVEDNAFQFRVQLAKSQSSSNKVARDDV
jgi:hypothetical protein